MLEVAKRGVNRVLRPMGFTVTRVRTADERQPWDGHFERWITDAEEKGGDPNDIGDQHWGDPMPYLERHYLPHVGEDKVVLEVGPGTGRYTRHIIGRCARMILVETSSEAAQWLTRYLDGSGSFEVHHVSDCALSPIPSVSVDVVFANGVFEHLYMEDCYRYLAAFHRVLKPGGSVALNFNNIMSTGGFDRFRTKVARAGDGRSIFRYYHPEMFRKICEELGFRDITIATDESRDAFLECRRA